MTVTPANGTTWPHPATDSKFPAQSWRSHTVQVEARWGRSGMVISVRGEVDAANADRLTDYVRQCAVHSAWLVLDFEALEFMGTAGFAALQHLHEHIHGRTCWAIAPGSAVSRLLRICDPESVLPVAEAIPEALGRVQGSRLLQRAM